MQDVETVPLSWNRPLVFLLQDVGTVPLSCEIRKIIYTTNMIESYHRQLRKVTKGKSVFPSDEALLKMLYLVTQDVMLRWTGRIHNWGQILLQLSVFFPDRIKSSLL